jgi:hypothetical protein
MSNEFVCDSCLRAEAHQLSYPMSSSHFAVLLELMQTDVWDPAIDSFGNKKYYVSFIDDFSKFTWIYLIHHKSEVFNSFNRKILVVQSD